MEVEARMLGHRGLDLRAAVGAAVVQDQIQLRILWGTHALSEEPQVLLVAMVKVDLADHGAFQQVESDDQSGAAVALVVVGHGLTMGCHCW